MKTIETTFKEIAIDQAFHFSDDPNTQQVTKRKRSITRCIPSNCQRAFGHRFFVPDSEKVMTKVK